MIDVNRLIGEVAARNGIRVEPGDPAFALVTLNQLVLEEAARQLTEEIRSGIAEFTVAVQRTETRAGKLLAQQVKEAAAEVRQELQRDIENARLKAADMVTQVHRAHKTSALVRWGAAGLICAVALFGAGLWIGAHWLQ
jgi:ubiquinone biosynthesis protein UbiJ